MNCSEVKELLSAYYDDELSPEKRAAVLEHLEGCDDCAYELDSFRGLSILAAGLTHPEPPSQLWGQIEAQLDKNSADVQTTKSTSNRLWHQIIRPHIRNSLAVAALIVIALGWFGYRSWFDHGGEHQFTAEFARYLDEFTRDPQSAQRMLLAKYEGRPLVAGQALQTVGYRPAITDGLPAGYTLESIYVMKMPCCTCVQCNCQRGDGSILAIFEHDDEETNEWFGDRPEMSVVCNGTPCNLVELDNRFAATWKRGKRYITVIGARDSAEVGELIAWFDKGRQIQAVK